MVAHQIDVHAAQLGVLAGVVQGEVEGGDARVLDNLDLAPHHFPNPVLRRVWGAIRSCFAVQEVAHPEDVFARLEDDREAHAELVAILDSLARSTWGVTAYSTRVYARELVAFVGDAAARLALSQAKALADDGDLEKAMSVMRSAIAEHEQGTREPTDPGAVAGLLALEVPRMLSDEPVDPRSVRWGLDALDRAGSFLRPGDFGVLAARPGAGKTTFAIQTAIGALRRHSRPVLFFSLEMTPASLAKKAVLHIAGSRDPESNSISQAEREEIQAARTWLDGQPLFIPPNPPPRVDEFSSWAREHIRLRKPAVVFIDYLGLVRGVGSNAYERTGDTSRKLRAIALDTEVPIVALHQMNRQAETDGRQPQLRDLRDSGQIEQDATLVGFLHHQRDEQTGARRSFLLTRKSRFGGTPTIELQADFEHSRMFPLQERAFETTIRSNP